MILKPGLAWLFLAIANVVTGFVTHGPVSPQLSPQALVHPSQDKPLLPPPLLLPVVHRAQPHCSMSALSSSKRPSDGAGTGIKEDPLLKLLVSILIDLIGMSSYTIPIGGELADVGWAPISAVLIWYLYGNGVIAGLGFAEEILPGFDIFPTATVAWFLENSALGQSVNRAAAGTDQETRDPKSRKSVMDPREKAEGVVDID
ncbi:unnamed protein product [Chrysoparadoxa australica]